MRKVNDGATEDVCKEESHLDIMSHVDKIHGGIIVKKLVCQSCKSFQNPRGVK